MTSYVVAVVMYILWSTSKFSVDASCEKEQKSHCSNMYYKATSFWYQDTEIQKCIPRQYVDFTHVCTVTNFLPNIDFCCCTIDESIDKNELVLKTQNNHGGRWKKRWVASDVDNLKNGNGTIIKRKRSSVQTSVLCCRYQHDWDKFRCQKSDDYFDPNSLDDTSNLSTQAKICYGFIVSLTLALIFTICCLIKKNKKQQKILSRRCVKNNQGNKTASSHKNSDALTSPSYNKIDGVGKCSSNRNLIPIIEPSAPTEEEVMTSRSSSSSQSSFQAESNFKSFNGTLNAQFNTVARIETIDSNLNEYLEVCNDRISTDYHHHNTDKPKTPPPSYEDSVQNIA